MSFILLEAAGQYTTSAQLKKEINRIIRHEQPIDFDLVPGALIGVFMGDSTYIFSVGNAPDKDAIFELGSLTKPVMAYLTHQVTEDRQISLEEGICLFLPDSLCHGVWQQVTIGDLLRHRCGLPKVTAGMARGERDITDPYATYQIEDLAGDVMAINPLPGQYSYAHLNYMMLHWVLETGGGLEHARRKYIEEDLGLVSMRFEVPDSSITDGYGLNGYLRFPWHPKAMAPAVGLKASITDMLDFIRITSVRQEALRMTKAMKRDLDAKARREVYDVSNGWFLVPSGKHLLGFHTGHTGGHHASAAFVFGMDIGIVVFSNGASGSGDLSIRVLEMLLKGSK